MDEQRKKELLEAYKHRRPEMGVIAYRCKATGETFLGISTDTRADFNSNDAKLAMHSHPNKRMQALWNAHGKDGFERSVLRVLKYEDPHENHTEELEALREKCMEADSQAQKIWR